MKMNLTKIIINRLNMYWLYIQISVYLLWNLLGTKRAKVIAEHKVDFAKVLDVFDDNFAVYIEDFEHSTDDEIRFNVIGKSASYGVVFAVFNYDESNDIRFITDRKAEN